MMKELLTRMRFFFFRLGKANWRELQFHLEQATESYIAAGDDSRGGATPGTGSILARGGCSGELS